MSNKSKKPVLTGNIQDKQKTDFSEPNIILRKKYAFDKRLTSAEKGVLTMLKALPPTWELKLTHTAKFMNLSKNTLKSALDKLEKTHYLERVKLTYNSYSYFIVDPLEIDENGFDPLSIQDYTDRQKYYFLKSDKTKQEYKDFIQGYLKLQFNKKGDVSYNDILSLYKKYCYEEYKQKT